MNLTFKALKRIRNFSLESHPALMTLTAMIVLGSMSLLIVVFVMVSSVEILQQGLHDTASQEVFVAADACVEEALTRLNSDPSYSGETFIIGNVSCTVTLTGASNVLLTADATMGTTYATQIQVLVDVTTSPITITNWEEI